MIGVNNDVYPGERIVTVTSIEQAMATLTPDAIASRLKTQLWRFRITAHAIEAQVKVARSGKPTAVAKLAFSE